MKARFALAILAIAMLCTCALAQENTAGDWFNMGQELFRDESKEEAVKAYDRAIELNPQ